MLGGDGADRAQARLLTSVLTDETGTRLAALVEGGKARVEIPPGPPIGETDWFGDLVP